MERAIDRARKTWRGEAAIIRHGGVRGPMETLDRMASGARGIAAPTQLTKLAVEMRDAGCAEAEVRERLHGIGDLITALVFHPAAS